MPLPESMEYDELQRTSITTYTKHYYIGTERIAGALGTMKNLGLLCEVVWPGDQTIITEMGTKTIAAGNALIADYFSFEKDLHLPEPYLYETYICADLDHHPENYDAYWYHPDHLGSSNYITNLAGRVNQHMEYLPFGETLVEEHLNSYNSPYRFNAKELDAETGWYYYGARYYNPKWSIWLSVDPLAGKYPGWSPYAYVHNNPINMIDPTGMEAEWIPELNDDGSTSYIAEDGDSAATLSSQYGISQSDAEAITGTTGNTEIAEGTEISGQQVMNVTGSEVLKLDLHSPEGRSEQRRFDQFLFARDHSNSKGAYSFLSTDYFSNTKYMAMMTGDATACIGGGDGVNLHYKIPMYRPATFDGSSTAVGLSNFPLTAKQTLGNSFPNQENIHLPVYHPNTGGRMGHYEIFVGGKNSNRLLRRLEKDFPQYNYIRIPLGNND